MNLLKFSCTLTGFDYDDVKNQNHKSKTRVSTYGLVMLVPMILWFINGSILGSRIFELNFLFSILIGATLALIIWIFERSIIQLDKSKSLTRFRIALGILFALLGSFLLDEMIFIKDIEYEIVQMKIEKVEINLVNFNTKYQNKLKELKDQRNLSDSRFQEAQLDAKNEADGTGGSGHKGVDKIASFKQNIANGHLANKNNLETEIKQLETQYTIEEKNERTKFESEFDDNGLLLNMKALFRIVFGNIYAFIFWLIMTAILFAIEFLVIIVKSSSKPTDYELWIEQQSQIRSMELKEIMNTKILMTEKGHNTFYNQNKPQFGTA